MAIPDSRDVLLIRAVVAEEVAGGAIAYSALTGIPAAIDAIDGLTPAADRVAYYTGASSAALTTLTSFARTLLDDADAATARSTLGAQAATTITTYTSSTPSVGTGVGVALINAASTGAVTVTLPAGATHLTGIVTVKDRKGDTGGATPITIATTGGETIDGSATAAMTVNYQALTLAFSGSEWSII